MQLKACILNSLCQAGAGFESLFEKLQEAKLSLG